MRNTPVTDSDIQCFNITKNLRELYLDCPTYLRNIQLSNTNRSGDDNQNNVPPSPPPIAPEQPVNNLIPHENNRPIPNFDLVVVLPNSAQRQNNPDNGERIEPVVQVQQRQREVLARNVRDDGSVLNLYLYRHNMYPYYAISDRGILSYGRVRPQVNQNLVYIRAAGVEERPEHTSLEVLYIRNYEKITNASLEHLAHCSPKLKLLDVSGTSVTKDGVLQFKLLKTQCKVISDFELDDD